MLTKNIIEALKGFFSLRPRRDSRVTERRAKFGVLAIALTQLGDTISTYLGITYANAREANGIMLDVLTEHGWLGFIAVKVFATVFLSWFTYRRKYAPWVISGLYAFITIWNLALTTFLLGWGH